MTRYTYARHTRAVAMCSAAALLVVAGACRRPPAVLNVQMDPGKAGNGVEAQPGPYAMPAEMSQRQSDAPAGKLSESAVYRSKLYGKSFRYRIYVPAQLRPNDAAALMVFQDASSVYLDVMRTPVVMDNLIHAGEMPLTIALFLDPGTETGEFNAATDSVARSEQYDASDERYGRFLVEEIIPAVVQKNYRLVNDPNGWAIAGHGSGGFAAFNAAWWYSDYFRKVLTQNASFVEIRNGGGAYQRTIRSELPKPLRVYLLSGNNDLVNTLGNWREANWAVAGALEERGYDYRFRMGTGEHSPPLQAQADFVSAMRWLWRGFQSGRRDGK